MLELCDYSCNIHNWIYYRETHLNHFVSFFSGVFCLRYKTRIKKKHKEVFDWITEFVVWFVWGVLGMGFGLILFFPVEKHLRDVGFYCYDSVIPQFISNSLWDTIHFPDTNWPFAKPHSSSFALVYHINSSKFLYVFNNSSLISSFLSVVCTIFKDYITYS